MNKIDKKNKIIFRRVAVLNIVTVAIALFLWFKYHNHIGGLFVIISAWSSWVYIKMTRAYRYIDQAIGYTKENIKRKVH